MKIHNKRIIVTGGAGVIGRELISILVKEGIHIRCFDVATRPKWMPKDVEYYKCDLAELNEKDFISFQPEIIFHLAAVFERTQEPLNFWEPNFLSNVVATHKVIEAATRCKDLLKFIFASSYLVYSTDLYFYKRPPARPTLIKESDLINPRNLCGAAKYYSEKELEFLCGFNKYNFKSISARIYRVYGLGSRDVISRWARSALRREEIRPYGKENSYDYIFAADVALGLLKLAESNIAEGPVNLASGKSRKISEVINILKNNFPDLKMKDIHLRHPFEASCGALSLLKKFTGWQPQIKLEEGIRRIIDFERGYR